MKDTVLKLAVQIRERIKDTPPQIVESTSALILMDIAKILYESDEVTFSPEQYLKMNEHITELYKL